MSTQYLSRARTRATGSWTLATHNDLYDTNLNDRSAFGLRCVLVKAKSVGVVVLDRLPAQQLSLLPPLMTFVAAQVCS